MHCRTSTATWLLIVCLIGFVCGIVFSSSGATQIEWRRFDVMEIQSRLRSGDTVLIVGYPKYHGEYLAWESAFSDPKLREAVVASGVVPFLIEFDSLEESGVRELHVLTRTTLEPVIAIFQPEGSSTYFRFPPDELIAQLQKLPR